MKFDKSVPPDDRRKIEQALCDIKLYGGTRHRAIAQLIEETEVAVLVDTAVRIRGSGNAGLANPFLINWAISRGDITFFEAWRFVKIGIARETIDGGGQRGIEGTFLHEGKHAEDFATMIATFSTGDPKNYFDPHAFQREYSAHLTTAFYGVRRGGEFAAEGLDLGLLVSENARVKVSPEGIRERLKNNYGLTPDAPGKHLSEVTFPSIAPRGKSLWGIF